MRRKIARWQRARLTRSDGRLIKLRATVRRSPGRCTHALGGIVGGEVVPIKKLPQPAWVEIHEDKHGWFLFYFDADGEFLTDGWHETLEKAKHQAAFEFEIRADEWTMMG